MRVWSNAYIYLTCVIWNVNELNSRNEFHCKLCGGGGGGGGGGFNLLGVFPHMQGYVLGVKCEKGMAFEGML